MKNMKKSLLLLTAVVVLLMASVGGTVAYLATQTESVTNTFTPANVSTDVTDEINGNIKKNVKVTNKSDIPVYIRVAVVANWMKDGNVVAPWSDYGGLGISNDWIQIGGYYYYRTPVAAGAEVTLFNSYAATGGPDGAHLEMDIIAQAIQAEPTTVVESAWNVTVSNGSITGAGN